MKDTVLLLITGVICAGLSWAFFSYLGQDAFSVLLIISIVTLSLDNRRLRRQLREQINPP